jgi:hypothetical protein
MNGKNPKQHHNCEGAYPSWETSYDKNRTVAWCYGCGRTWYQDTGEEAHLYDREVN